MTSLHLQQYSREQLEALAKKRGVSNVRQLRKAALIDALSATPFKTDVERPTVETSRRLSAKNRLPAQPVFPQRTKGNPASPRTNRPVRSNESAISPAAPDHDAIYVEVLDETWLRVSWQVCPSSRDRAAAALGKDWHTATPLLQVSDVTPAEETPASEVTQEYDLQSGRAVWYVRIADPDRTYRIAIGYRTKKGKSYLLLRSRSLTPSRQRPQAIESTIASQPPLSTTQNSPSPRTAAQAGNEAASLGGLRARFDTKLPEELAGWGTASPSLPLLGVEVELLVHGMTQPGTHVTLHSRTQPVGVDGRFIERLPLESGRHVIPVRAVSKDGLGERTVVIALDVSTREMEPRITGETW